jgi:hypothetical protein
MKALHLAGSCLLALSGLAVGSAALAAPQPSGVAVAVIQSTEDEGVGGKQVLQPAAPVYSGDRIVTGAVGEAQIRFSDNTKLVVGPDSSLVIDAFVFNADNSASQVTINAVRGAFRFLTGNSAKDAYAINTPTATIAVRGTEFDLDVDQGGATYVAQIGGQTRICSRDRKDQTDKERDRHCVVALPGCNIFVADANRDPRELKSKADHDLAVQRKFRYVRDQKGLLAGFQLDVSACGAFAGSSPNPLLPLAPLLPLVPFVVPPVSP